MLRNSPKVHGWLQIQKLYMGNWTLEHVPNMRRVLSRDGRFLILSERIDGMGQIESGKVKTKGGF